MKKHSAKISVLMPAYNAENYIAEAIDSILEQSLNDFEFIIINDGSTDDTKQIFESYSDPRIIAINKPHTGIAESLNIGLAVARAPYIARFDADDISLPQRLEHQFNFLNTHPEYIVCGSNAEYISEDGDHLFNYECSTHTHEQIMQKIYSQCPFIHSSVMFRRDAVAKAGGYSIYAHNFEDYFLWIQLKQYGKFYNLRQQLIKVRFNPSSSTIDEKWRGHLFRKLKRQIIKRGIVTKKEGDELLSIIESQDIKKIKEGSYYALCGKKFLVNNHQPKKARPLLSKAIKIDPYRWDNYVLYLLSYFPGPFIGWLHKSFLPKFTDQ